MQRVFITGVSSGIGPALVREYLRRGDEVHGISRRAPADLFDFDRFYYASLDLHDHERATQATLSFLDEVDHLHLAILNAGILGEFGDLAEQSLGELKHVMEVNLWANKTVIDCLFADGRRVDQVVTMSSAAALSGNRGWAGYALSKAALNMLTRLYARENPRTHFAALSPGLVDTAMQEEIAHLPHDDRYPSLDRLRSRRHTADMPDAQTAAPALIEAMARLPRLVASGEFADIGQLPPA
jgi:benzil reductase ((S)-benzoin forming)